MRKIGVYIDGFNLYYGLYKHKPGLHQHQKWLDLVRLSQQLAKQLHLSGTVVNVRYFTARTLPSPNDPGQPTPQDTFIRALETLPEISIHWGQHIETTKKGRLKDDLINTIREFIVREEKGSDVNIASYLLLDNAKDTVDASIVGPNDSDLADAIRLTIDQFGKPVFVVSPQPYRYLSGTLRRSASGAAILNVNVLQACQLPNPVSRCSRKGYQQAAKLVKPD